MRILVTIPHFFSAAGGRHGSTGPDPRPRVQALTACLTALRQLSGSDQRFIHIARRAALPVRQSQGHTLEVVVCTSGDNHLLGHLRLPPGLYSHHPTTAQPMLLGFECQAVLRDYIGQFDYYCFLEDDLVLHDPWFFAKLAWFSRQAEPLDLLQPHRYEVMASERFLKVYIDGDLAPDVTARFQDVKERPVLTGKVMGADVAFRRTLNPHAGCYFLNAEQMAAWAAKSYFLDRDVSFVGPLESAATLGIMRTFRVYKPGPESLSFLEIQHFGSAFARLIRPAGPPTA